MIMINRLTVLALALALFSGCGSDATQRTGLLSNSENLCDSEKDVFCIENDKQMAAKHNQLGLDHAKKMDYEKALEEFQMAVKLDGQNALYLYSLGLSYANLRRFDAAEAAYMKSISFAAEDQNLLIRNRYNLACIYAVQGKKKEALDQLQIVSSFDDSVTHFQLAQTDKDLDSIRNDPRFASIMEQMGRGAGDRHPAARHPAEGAK